VVNHEGSHLIEKGPEESMGFRRESRFGEGVVHELHPAVTSGLIDAKGKMACAETRMSAFGDVILRAAETVDQEIAKTFLGSGAFVRGIHRAENIIGANLSIKGRNESSEAVFANDGVEILFVHEPTQSSTGAKTEALRIEGHIVIVDRTKSIGG
jgi:hypothetical protein